MAYHIQQGNRSAAGRMPCGERGNMEKELYEGICRFCGQMVEYDEDVLHDAKGDSMTAAKLVCDCPQAKIYQAKRKNIQLGIKRVEAVAGGGESGIKGSAV